MGLGRQGDLQGTMYLAWDEIPRSRGHVFYDRLQQILRKSGFDAFAEKLCKPYYSNKGRPSIPPGRYFRMHLVGYFEGIDSERGIEWRCADSLSLRDFLQLSAKELVPAHSSLSRTRSRLPLETHREVFTWVLKVLRKDGLVLGGRIGVDASTMEANEALKTIVRRDTGESYRKMLQHMAKESGIDSPTDEDLARMDRKRTGKTLSNKDWESPTDPEAKITKMKDGRTHLAYKPEHAVDLDTGAIVAIEVHEADKGDTSTLQKTLEAAQESLARVTPTPPCPDDPAELVADKGYFSRDVLKDLDGGPWRTRIAEPKRNGLNSWRGDHEARRAVYNNRVRISSMAGKAMGKQRTELVERSFEHTLDRAGGMRRVWLRGRENVQKRYLLHVAGFNLGLLMRVKTGYGTPRGWANAWFAIIWFDSDVSVAIFVVVMLVENEARQVIPVAGMFGGH
jgi:transposase